MVKNILKYVLSLGFAVGILYWTLKDYDFVSNWQKIKQANFFYVFLVAAITVISHAFRALRNNLLLEPLGYKPTGIRNTCAVLIGYLANYLVPRLGEVTRCGTLNASEKVPFDKAFGTVITERIVDVLCLLVLLILNFVLEFDRLGVYFIDFFKSKFNWDLSTLLWVIGGMVLEAVITYFIFRIFKDKILQIGFVQKLIGVYEAILAKLKGFIDGVMSITQLKQPVLFLGYTFGIWFCYYLMTYLLFFAMPETAHLSPLAGLSTLVVGAIGIAAPTPGGIGTYHALVSNLMTLYGLNAETGQTLAIFMHGSQMVSTILIGIFAFVLINFLPKRNSAIQQ